MCFSGRFIVLTSTREVIGIRSYTRELSVLKIYYFLVMCTKFV